ncbi:NAD(P)H-hydrate dehydratase [Venenivibrio stagnispumantis]|nr:NAD(P)H-hydrate dehydratase [Venenivibrio stagnispumantis]MCW4572408.1 NAD(P)H-hydrate dehydratase [Venenivibrio stagnispumantis]
MMKVLKASEIALIDKKTIEETGIASLVLMENAGRSCYQIIKEKFNGLKKVAVFVGSGNNGGDGLVIARYLLRDKIDVDVYILSNDENKLSADNKKNLEIFKNFGGKYKFIAENNINEIYLNDVDLIIDAIFGTGFKPPISGYREEIIKLINKSNKKVVSVDIPSGLSADSGKIEGEFIKADITITFGFKKLVHILYPASEYCGEVYLVDISLNEKYAEDIKRYILTKDIIKLPKREKTGHKYTFGHVAVIGGSVGKSGAVIMASKSASVSGAGLVTAIVPSSINQIVETNLIEEMSIPVSDKDGIFSSSEEIINILKNGKFSSIVVGMGMSVNENTTEIVKSLLNIDKPIVIDADGLNNLAKIENYEILLKEREKPTVLTPHIGEFQRLIKREIPEDLEEIAKDFAIKTNSYLVLKSARTIIATPDGKVYYNIIGNAGMATAGTGDVLAGMLGALINRLLTEEAVKTAVYLHSFAGDLAKLAKSEESLKATAIIEFIPQAIKQLSQ